MTTTTRKRKLRRVGLFEKEVEERWRKEMEEKCVERQIGGEVREEKEEEGKGEEEEEDVRYMDQVLSPKLLLIRRIRLAKGIQQGII